MKLKKQQLLKLFTIAIAVTLAAGSLIFGGAPSKTSAAAFVSAQETTDTRDEATPQAESIEAAPLEKETDEGNALLLVRFVPDAKVAPTITTVIEEREVLLRDDGLGSDAKAGDGVYSAIAFIDFNALADNQDRVSEQNANPEPTPAEDTTQTTELTASSSADATDGTERESLASSDAVLMPAFENSRDRQGTVAVPKVDFRNLKPGQFVPLKPLATYYGVDPQKSLVITNVKVVEDPTRTFNPCTGRGTPMGAWTFGRLMTNMANQPLTGITPPNFVRQWLNKWLADQTTANGWTAAKRLQMQNLVIGPWEAASGGPGMPLNLAKAPFRLLAIVNRVDLRSAGTAYGGGNAGEGRFVFGVMDMRPVKGGGIDPYTGLPQTNCAPTQFTVIIEYGIDRRGCPAIRNWGQQWYNLKFHVLGSASYNAALQAITDQFTNANVAPGKPNGSALNQLRTNEIAIANPAPDDRWQLREFRLPVGNGHLFEANAKQTPHESRRNTDLTAHFVNSTAPGATVPDFWLGQKFLTNASDVPSPAVFWSDGPTITIMPRNDRHDFSLNACSGCHARETDTIFTHVKPAPFGTPAGLSGFMTGINVIDPADGAPTRNFNEFKRRALDLDKLVHTPCFLSMLSGPPPAVH
ncbi:MAG TPA: choice-of-anchor X domain-containing protein [Pyrinomonadaceae bacterium]|jgi:hypothetical protein|nr:choice-of-anchor X domain-containing protein [Pyrinomonadaceae bacterium]